MPGKYQGGMSASATKHLFVKYWIALFCFVFPQTSSAMFSIPGQGNVISVSDAAVAPLEPCLWMSLNTFGKV